MADPFVAEIRIFPFSFAPKGWAFCDGQLLPLSQNTALFSLVGTTYGGDGKSTFRFAPRSTRFLVQPLSQGCGTVRLNIHVRYHMFGLPLSQTVPAFTKLGRPC